jgi:hypothetical protein
LFQSSDRTVKKGKSWLGKLLWRAEVQHSSLGHLCVFFRLARSALACDQPSSKRLAPAQAATQEPTHLIFI